MSVATKAHFKIQEGNFFQAGETCATNVRLRQGWARLRHQRDAGAVQPDLRDVRGTACRLCALLRLDHLKDIKLLCTEICHRYCCTEGVEIRQDKRADTIQSLCVVTCLLVS